jgi:hypothetical protein
MKYDIEVSGFGSEALGHVCLLNLKEQVYPGCGTQQGLAHVDDACAALGQGARRGHGLCSLRQWSSGESQQRRQTP